MPDGNTAALRKHMAEQDREDAILSHAQLLIEAEARDIIESGEKLELLLSEYDIRVGDELSRALRSLDIACRTNKQNAVNAVLSAIHQIEQRCLDAARHQCEDSCLARARDLSRGSE
jgi:hypothetical protein